MSSDVEHARMKPCRWCSQPIAPTALLCNHCRTWQRDDADREALIFDRDFVRWGKVYLIVAGAIVAGLIAIFGFNLKNASEEAWIARKDALSSQVDARMYADNAKTSADHASTDSDRLLQEARIRNEAEGKKIDEQRKYIDGQVDQITGTVRGAQGGDISKLGDNLKNMGDTISGQQGQIADLAKRITTLEGKQTTPEAKPTTLSDDKIAAFDQILRIKLTASKVAGSTSDGARQSYDLSFTVCTLVTSSCGADRLNEIDRVVYRFDTRWFSIPNVPVADRETQFRYGLRVWGVTQVRACVFLKGAPDKPIVRVGPMNLGDEATYWGPDHTGSAEDCSGLNGL